MHCLSPPLLQVGTDACGYCALSYNRKQDDYCALFGEQPFMFPGDPRNAHLSDSAIDPKSLIEGTVYIVATGSLQTIIQYLKSSNLFVRTNLFVHCDFLPAIRHFKDQRFCERSALLRACTRENNFASPICGMSQLIAATVLEILSKE